MTYSVTRLVNMSRESIDATEPDTNTIFDTFVGAATTLQVNVLTERRSTGRANQTSRFWLSRGRICGHPTQKSFVKAKKGGVSSDHGEVPHPFDFCQPPTTDHKEQYLPER